MIANIGSTDAKLMLTIQIQTPMLKNDNSFYKSF